MLRVKGEHEQVNNFVPHGKRKAFPTRKYYKEEPKIILCFFDMTWMFTVVVNHYVHESSFKPHNKLRKVPVTFLILE